MKHLPFVYAALLALAGGGLPAHAESPQPSLPPLPAGTERIVLQPNRLQPAEAVRFEAENLSNNQRFQLAFQDGRLIDLYYRRSVEFTADHRRSDVRIWQAQAAALWPQEVTPLDDAAAYACYLSIGEKARERMQRQLDAQAPRGAP